MAVGWPDNSRKDAESLQGVATSTAAITAAVVVWVVLVLGKGKRVRWLAGTKNGLKDGGSRGNRLQKLPHQ